VLPNAQEWRGSLIGLDLKREFGTKSARRARRWGRTSFCFLPASEKFALLEPARSRGAWPSRATDVTNIARSLIPAPASGDSIGRKRRAGLFAGLLGYVLDSATMVGKRTIKSALNYSAGVKVWSP